MHNYSVKKQDNSFFLVKDGFDVACPFQQSIVSQNQDGGINIMRIPCSTHCALAELRDEEVYEVTTGQTKASEDLITKKFYVTTCGNCEKKHQVSLSVNNLKSI